MKALITGRSGVGKSTICRELKQNGLPGLDSDRVPGLCNWRNLHTNDIVAVDNSLPIDKSEVAWTWDEYVLNQLLHENKNIFLCGGADNQLRFHNLFNVIFVLDIPPAIQRQRILSRTEHDYGQQLALQDQIMEEQKLLVQEAVRLGAIVLDASPSPAEIVAVIAEYVYAH